MKLLISIIVSAAVAALAVYAVVSRQKDTALNRALADQRQKADSDLAALQEELAAARRRPVVIQQTPAEPASVVQVALPDPEQVLAKLKTLRASSRDPKSIRKVIYHLEQLREIGPPSVPVIRAFLNRFEDVDYYSVRTEEEGERSRRGPGEGDGRPRFGPEGGDERGGPRPPRFDPGDFRQNRFDVRLTFTTPPSLRLGLVDVLAGIGGSDAEETLVEMLETTGRAVEVAYVAKTLQEVAPNKYGSTAIAAATDLLLNPTQGAAGDRLDENARDYLYQVLLMFNDTSFASHAQGLLIGADGRIDRQALAYLNQSLKEQAMPAIYQAFLDQRITNQWERASLMNLALNYAGPNAQANQMLNSVIADESIPPQMRAMALMGLTRGEPDPATLQARIPLVEALKGSTEDERMQRMLEVTSANLRNMLEGKPPEQPWRMFMDGGGDGGRPRGFREGRGRGPEGSPGVDRLQGSDLPPRP